MNTKSTICRNLAKSLKLYKLVQILSNVFHTDTIAEKNLEHIVSLYTRFAYHDRIRTDYHNNHTVLIFNKKLPNNRFHLCKSYLLSNEYSYKSLCWPNVTSQSQTSFTMKLISNLLL